MPTSYTSRLRLALPATGELSNTWGDTVNNSITSMVEQAVAGYTNVTHTDVANYTLTTANGASDESRNMMINVSGTLTANRNVVCPTASKLYFVKNSTTGGFNFTFKTSGGTGVVIPNGAAMVVYCDGTNVVDGINTLSALSLVTALAVAQGGTGATNASGARTNLGLGTMATVNSPAPVANGGTGSANASGARTNLGLGTIATVDSPVPIANGGTAATSAADARTNLGLGTVATVNSPVPIANGGTAATSAADARTNLGLGTIATQAANNVSITGGSATGLTSLSATTATMTKFIETRSSVAISTNTLTLDLANANVFTCSLNANITTLNINNPASSGTVSSFILQFTADGTPRTVTWPASVKWAGGTAPTLTSTNNKIDAFGFYTQDGGTSYIASRIGQNY